MATFYIPKEQGSAVKIVLTQEEAEALRSLIAGVRAMAGPDPYYGYLCRVCGTRFVGEGQPKHEKGCIVPLAEQLTSLSSL